MHNLITRFKEVIYLVFVNPTLRRSIKELKKHHNLTASDKSALITSIKAAK